jgi:hypothetical protein
MHGISIDAHIENAENMAAAARDELTRKTSRKAEAPEEAAQEWQDRAKALRRWKLIGQDSSYEQLVDHCFSREYRDPINRPLIDVLRKLVFTSTVEGRVWWTDSANRDLAFRMLPDEAVTSAFIEICRIGAAEPGLSMGAAEVSRRALPALGDTTHFQVGDTLRFLIHAGLEASAEGKPYLTG